jgi:predicted type IV restriction endonuclease
MRGLMQGELEAVLAQMRDRVTRYRGMTINEQNTKAALIDPILRALGWDLEDLDEVQREFKPQSADKPVDYAILVLGTPRVFIEAKALGENLSDRRWANQIMGYAAVAGVDWVVLTNGDEYRIYNAHAPVPVEEKLFRSVEIGDENRQAEETLSLLSKEQMQKKQIEALWAAHFVDRQIRETIGHLFAADPDPSLVSLIRKRRPELTPGEIRAGLRRVRIHLTFPSEPQAQTEVPSLQPSPRLPVPPPDMPSTDTNASLQRLIRAGVIRPPMSLYKFYKGRRLIAQVEPDGRVTFEGATYNSLSVAGGMARAAAGASFPGKKYPPTNGWVFWQFIDDDGRSKPVDVLRGKYADARMSDERDLVDE